MRIEIWQPAGLKMNVKHFNYFWCPTSHNIMFKLEQRVIEAKAI